MFEVLLDIYVEYGFSKETTVNVVKPGKSGAEESVRCKGSVFAFIQGVFRKTVGSEAKKAV